MSFEIEKVSLSVQIEGKACFVMLSQEKLKLLVGMAAALCDDGRLKVMKAPESYKFSTLEDLKGKIK